MHKSKHKKILISSTVVFVILWLIVGHFLGFIKATRCFQYLGCNAGFGGYDAITHFLGGVIIAVFLIWFFGKFQKFNILYNTTWKNIVLVLAITALASIGWETLELVYDQVAVGIWHQGIWEGQAVQLSNIDTMGDLVSNILGAVAAIVFVGF